MSVPITRQVAALVAEQPLIARRMAEAVRLGRLRPAERDYLLESVEAAIATLEWCRDNEATIKRVHKALQAGEEA